MCDDQKKILFMLICDITVFQTLNGISKWNIHFKMGHQRQNKNFLINRFTYFIQMCFKSSQPVVISKSSLNIVLSSWLSPALYNQVIIKRCQKQRFSTTYIELQLVSFKLGKNMAHEWFESIEQSSAHNYDTKLD